RRRARRRRQLAVVRGRCRDGVLHEVDNQPGGCGQARRRRPLRRAVDAGARNYVGLSIVGVDELPDSGYMRAKVVQEKIITESGLPYTIVRATQFAEFAYAITHSVTVDNSGGDT